MDLLACLPISYIQQLVESSHGSGGSDDHLKLLKSLRLFRLAKLLRLARFRRLIKRWEVRSDPPASVTASALRSAPLLFCPSVPFRAAAVLCCGCRALSPEAAAVSVCRM